MGNEVEMVKNTQINLHRNATKRNAWCAPVCLGLHTKPHFSPITTKGIEGGMAGLVTEEREDTTEFQCFPLARFLSKISNISPIFCEFVPWYSHPQTSPSILFAVGNQTVNYLSLDIEGAELQVTSDEQ